MRGVGAFVGMAYVAMTAFALLVVNLTTLGPSEVLPGVVIMWLIYIPFRLGTRETDKGSMQRVATPVEDLGDSSGSLPLQAGPKTRFESQAFLLAIVSVPSSVVLTQFVAGVTPFQVIANLRDGASAYDQYQAYGKTLVDLGVAQQLPYVLLMILVQVAWMYSALRLLVVQRKTTPLGLLALLMLGAAALYPSLARGTTFEAFKVGVFIAFVLWLRSLKYGAALRSVALQILLLAAGIRFFLFNIASRGVISNGCMSRDVCLENKPSDESAGLESFEWLYGYFGNGFHYLSVLTDRVWLSSFEEFVEGLLPFGLFGLRQTTYRERMPALMDIGVMWHPDLALFMSWAGLLSLLVFCYLGGVLLNRLNALNGAIPMMGMFLICLQMISFPVGNFLMVAIEYQGLALMLLAWYANERFRRKRDAPVDPRLETGVLSKGPLTRSHHAQLRRQTGAPWVQQDRRNR